LSITVNSTTVNGILEDAITFIIPSRKVEENSTVGTMPPSPTKGVNKGGSKVSGQGLSIHESNMASPIALQSTAISGQLSGARDPWSIRTGRYEIQCSSDVNERGRERSNLVDIYLWTKKY